MSSPLPTDGPPSPSNRKFSRSGKRGKLRNGTFILPGTGERVRRQITLRGPSSFNRNLSNSEEPILPLRRTYSQAGTFRMAVDKSLETLVNFWEWLQSPTARNVLKCSLAYLLGSMGTFLPPLANFLGHQDGKHLVATITVYFHPVRSAGSMAESALLGLGAFCYATFVGVSSMATAVYFERTWDLIQLAYAIIVIVFIGGGLGFVGWVKQRYSAPCLSVACSLASLAIITILTKENAVQVGIFSNDKIVQVMKMVIMGIISTSFVSLVIWPVSARTELRETMIRTTDSFGDMLTIITRSFLDGSETDMRSSSFNKAQSKYRSVFKELTKNLREAKFEHYLLGTEEQYTVEANLVNCMRKLAQSIGGLRSAATTQFSLLKEASDFGSSAPVHALRQYPAMSNLATNKDRFAVLTAIEEASEEGSSNEDYEPADGGRPVPLTSHPSFASVHTLPTVKTPSEIFARFILHLGPSMKSLAYTLSQTLQELPFGDGPDYAIKINEHFKSSLTDALKLYSGARAEALKELYRSKELDRDRAESIEADFEEVAASCGHFSFSLQAFANEMQNYLFVLEELKEVTERPSRSWKWLLFWQEKSKSRKGPQTIPEEEEALIEQSSPEAEIPKTLPDLVLERNETRQWRASAPQDAAKQGFYDRILRFIRFFERDDVRFAFKVGIGASLYALFAFIPQTRPFYQHWRGEWGLLSYMLVCAMTIGASNTTGWSRFIGTFIGAVIAVVVWVICQGNVFALAFCGWAISLPCSYLIVVKGQGPFGRFIMLTYNLSCLYAYSLSIKEGEKDEDEGGVTPLITEIVLHRVMAVLAGCVWGLIITRVIWPISARTKFKDGLSLLWLRMGLIWKKDPMYTLLEGQSSQPYMNLREEFILQSYVQRLDALRISAASEFELRGPFPSKVYARLMESTNKMLDSFHAMNVVLEKNLTASEGEAMLLKYTSDERAQLCSRISHLFQVLASGLKLEYPLNDALPDTSNARDRLLAKIFQYRKDVAGLEDTTGQVAKDEDYELLYAFILVTGQLAEEIKKVEREVEDLFGVLDEEVLRLV